MKIALKISALLLLATTTFIGCKKGEGDPFLSLRSRKARMAGEWKMTAGSSTYKAASYTVTATYDGTNANVAFTMSGNTQNDIIPYTMSWKIEKDGTFEMVTVDDGETTTQKGTWNFTGKVGDYKNKDHAIFTVTNETVTNTSGTSTTTYTGTENSMLIELHTLKNKELVVKSSSTTTAGSTTTENTFEYTLEQ